MAKIDQLSLVLASASPRRAQLLGQLGVEFRVEAANVNEDIVAEEKPTDYVERLAHAKAAHVSRLLTRESIALGADTIVVLAGEILGKPRDKVDAGNMLARLSGCEHEVLTGVCLVAGGGSEPLYSKVIRTQVTFRPLSKGEITRYVASGEPMDKAGAYGIQGVGAVFVRAIQGSYSNVVGLPLCETYEALQELGISCALN